MKERMHVIPFALGLVLILGGIASGKEGAIVVGLIVAAVNARRWLGLEHPSAQEQQN